MCAIEAGKRGRRVLVLERADRIGKKILISGGGRCNFTNLHAGRRISSRRIPISPSPRSPAITPEAFLSLVEKHRIPYHEKKLGQLFCDHSANDIVAMLEEECRTAEVEIKLNTKITHVRKSDNFIVETDDLAFSRAPPRGSHRRPVHRQNRRNLIWIRPGPPIRPEDPTYPPGPRSLHFTEPDRKRWCDLAGVSTEVIASTHRSKRAFREKMLFTHRGISGPAILQFSSYWDRRSPISIDLAPGMDLKRSCESAAIATNPSWKSLLREILPRRLADRWLEVLRPPDTRTAPSPTPKISSMHGKLNRTEPRATPKQKSQLAASIPTNCLRAPWNQERCPAFSSLEKSWTSPAN